MIHDEFWKIFITGILLAIWLPILAFYTKEVIKEIINIVLDRD